MAIAALLAGAATAQALCTPQDYNPPSCTITITGSEGSDTLYGAATNDCIYGLGANDTLDGANGSDYLVGGEGDDSMGGGGGNDFLDGLQGNDFLNGESGNDNLWGFTGNDLLLGGSGSDILCGEDGDDELYGGVNGTNFDSLDGGPNGTTKGDKCQEGEVTVNTARGAWHRFSTKHGGRLRELRSSCCRSSATMSRDVSAWRGGIPPLLR